jgi:hypothetical protein
LGARHLEHHVAREPFERLVLNELLVDLRVFLEQRLHHFAQGLVVRHARCMRRVRLGVLIGIVGRDFRGDVVPDAVHDTVSIGKQGAEGFIEGSKRSQRGSRIDETEMEPAGVEGTTACQAEHMRVRDVLTSISRRGRQKGADHSLFS